MDASLRKPAVSTLTSALVSTMPSRLSGVQELSAEQGFGGGDVQERVGTFFAPPTARTHADLMCEGSHHVQGQSGSEKKWFKSLFNKSLEHKRTCRTDTHCARRPRMEQTCRCLCSLLLLCVRSRGVRSSEVPSQSTFLVTSTSQVSGHLPDHHRMEYLLTS